MQLKKIKILGVIREYRRITKDQLDQLSTIKDSETLEEILKSCRERVDIDKSWQILNYLITGEKDFSNHVFEKLIYPDQHTIEISDEEYQLLEEYEVYGGEIEQHIIEKIQKKTDLSLGYVDPTEVNQINEELKFLDIKKIVEEADFSSFNELGIYPEIWSNSLEHKEYVKNHFDNLKGFLKRAEEEEEFILVFLES